MKLSDKRVLVTGADGFIGSHLAEALLTRCRHVRAFVYYNSFNSWGWLDTLPQEIIRSIEVFPGDVRDPSSVRLATKGVDVVFHLAALVGIPYSYSSPDSYVDTNIRGTLNVLQACRDYGIEKAVITSSSEVYGTARYVPIDEKHPLQGQSPYSATKIGADKIAESFHLAFGLPLVIARPFNTYGPRQSARAIIPTIVIQLLTGRENVSLGSLHPTRDLNFVTDICRGFLELAACDEAIGKAVNIGSGKEISMGELAKRIVSMLNPGATVVPLDERKRPEKSEVDRLLCDSSLITGLTGWRPEVSLEEGLARTIEWFKKEENLARYKGDLYNV